MTLQISSKESIQRNKQYQRKVLLRSFHLNGHTTGSQSSKYEHRRASAVLLNIQNTGQNIRICVEKKPIVSVTYENERISQKKQLTLLKMCVTSLLCGPRADMGFYVNGFLSI